MRFNRFSRFMPFLEGEGGGGTGGTGENQPPAQNQQLNQQQSTAPAFDYDKLASIISGKQSVTEDTILKNFFKQQGLSKEEMDQAINTFKQQKAEQTPDVNALTQQATLAQQAALSAEMEKEALLMATEVGVELKTIPYLMKLAETKEVIVEGKIDKEKLKAALDKVLEDVPQMKVQTTTEGGGGFKFGASGGGSDSKATEDQLKAAFGL